MKVEDLDPVTYEMLKSLNKEYCHRAELAFKAWLRFTGAVGLDESAKLRDQYDKTHDSRDDVKAEMMKICNAHGLDFDVVRQYFTYRYDAS